MRRHDPRRYLEAATIAVVAVPRLARMRWMLDRHGFAATRAVAERLGRGRPATRLGPDGTAAIVERVASLLPRRVNCLPRALTLWSLTRASGYPTDLKIGVAPREADGRPIEAHAWVELHGRALGESTARYVALAVDERRTGRPIAAGRQTIPSTQEAQQ